MLHRNAREAGILLLMPDGDAVKLFPSKGRLMTFFRSLTKQTKAHKQWNAAQKILQAGLLTPDPVSVEVFPAGAEYESAYIYRYLEVAKPFHEMLAEISADERLELLGELAEQVAMLANEDILFVDFHLGNFLVDAEDKIWWIDPEVKESRSYIQQKFWQRMERMHTKCNPGALSEDEWEFFCSKLKEKLRADLV